ncbi:MAG: alkylhydroperoxidase family enzyme [Planctomycetota bacterium]|jgi:alkylhydroperoxidase family enzyme
MSDEEPPAWIETIPADAWGDDLAPMKDASRDQETGEVDNILLVHSLHPSGLAGHLGVYRAAMAGTPGLRKVDRELVAMVVSKLNGCEY